MGRRVGHARDSRESGLPWRAVRAALLVVLPPLFLWAAPAQAFSKQTGFQTMSDGDSDRLRPVRAGRRGACGRLARGGRCCTASAARRTTVAPVAQAFASHGYAALAYSDRGDGTSTGDLTSSPARTRSRDERAMEPWFAGLPGGEQHADRRLGRLVRRRADLERARGRHPVQGGERRRDVDRSLHGALAAGRRALRASSPASPSRSPRSPLIAAVRDRRCAVEQHAGRSRRSPPRARRTRNCRRSPRPSTCSRAASTTRST